MQAKLFFDLKNDHFKGNLAWDLVDAQINRWLAGHAVKIISTHLTAVSDPTNHGQLTHSALIFYERSGSE